MPFIMPCLPLHPTWLLLLLLRQSKKLIPSPTPSSVMHAEEADVPVFGVTKPFHGVTHGFTKLCHVFVTNPMS